MAAPASDAGQHADDRHAGDMAAGKADDGADRHHALDAEVEHAGALRDQFAEGGKQQRRRGGDDGQQNAF